MTIDRIMDHFLIAALGWLIGMCAGVALGYGIAVLSRRVFPLQTRAGLLSTFFPWRTITAGLFLLNLFPYVPARLFGLGNAMGIVSTAFAILLCAAVLTIQTVHFTAAPAILRSISWARSLGVLSVVAAAHYGFYGGGGLGFVIQTGINLLDEQLALTAGWWLTGIALVFDLGVGFVEFLLKSKVLAGPSRHKKTL